MLYYFSWNNLQLASIAALMYWIASLLRERWIKYLTRTTAVLLVHMKCKEAAYLAFTQHNPVEMIGCFLIGIAVMLALINELVSGQLDRAQSVAMGGGFLCIADIPIFSILAAVFLSSHGFFILTNHPLQNRLLLIFWCNTMIAMYYSMYQDLQNEQFGQFDAKVLFVLCYFSMEIHPQPVVYMSIFSWFGFADLIKSYRNVF